MGCLVPEVARARRVGVETTSRRRRGLAEGFDDVVEFADEFANLLGSVGDEDGRGIGGVASARDRSA